MRPKITQQNVVDHLAIRDCMDRYTDAVNRRAWDEVEDLFEQEAGTWDVGGPDGPDGLFSFFFKGAKNVAKGMKEVIEQTELCFQQNTTIVIEVDGDRARARCGIRESTRMCDGETSSTLLGIYYDDLIRCEDGVWRFAIRRFRFVYLDTATPNPGELFSRPGSEAKTA